MKLSLRFRELDLWNPVVMGILNVTPDSFSDGGKNLSVDHAVARAAEMIEAGAKIIDIGGESTRPGAEPVSLETELVRVIPAVRHIRAAFPGIFISVDTTKYEVARAALLEGADILNDISGLRFDPKLAELAASCDAGLVLMHSIGNPKIMQNDPHYGDVVYEVSETLKKAAAMAQAAGVKNIILDYGIGFGKTVEHNLALLKATERFANLGYPVLVGASRKSIIGTLLGGRPVNDRVSGSVAVHLLAAERGASILRVHDVKPTVDALKILEAFRPRHH